MTKRTSYIAAAALAITGTVGMASWLSLSADDFERAAVAANGQALAEARPGVAETEATLPQPAPPPALELPAALPAVERAAVTYAAPPAAPRRAERATRTPVAPAQSATEPANPAEPADAKPSANAEAKGEPLEPLEPAEPAEPAFIEVRVPSGTILGVRLTTGVSSETAEIEDRVEATVTRDVIAEGRVAIAAGTKVLGSVNEVTRGGKFKERARLGVRFHTLVLADGARETIRVDAIVREGDSPARESAAKIGGGAVGGAIIGGIMGGKKGAILGGMAGAGAGGAAVAAGDRSIAALAAGSPLSVRLDGPIDVTIERN